MKFNYISESEARANFIIKSMQSKTVDHVLLALDDTFSPNVYTQLGLVGCELLRDFFKWCCFFHQLTIDEYDQLKFIDINSLAIALVKLKKDKKLFNEYRFKIKPLNMDDKIVPQDLRFFLLQTFSYIIDKKNNHSEFLDNFAVFLGNLMDGILNHE